MPAYVYENLPRDFRFGSATAAFAHEGAWDADGKSPSKYDHLGRNVGFARGHNFDNASGHYDLYKEDIGRMSAIGLNAYRFSVAWTRIIPDGVGPANPKGIAFYSRLLDTLLEQGIEPFCTIYHWDIPQSLQAKGGWSNPDCVHWFAQYVETLAAAFSGRITKWIPYNEPWVFALEHALPCIGYEPDYARYFRTVRHQAMARAACARALKAQNSACAVGDAFSLTAFQPASPLAADRTAAAVADAFMNRLYTDLFLKGRFPPELIERFPEFIADEAMDFEPPDFVGVNYYARFRVRAAPWIARWQCNLPWFSGMDVPDKEYSQGGRLHSSHGWEVYPQGLYDILHWVKSTYGNPLIYVLENGASFADQPEHGRIDDQMRLTYLAAHLQMVDRAIAEGVRCEGYFVWTLMNSLEVGPGAGLAASPPHTGRGSRAPCHSGAGRMITRWDCLTRDGWLAADLNRAPLRSAAPSARNGTVRLSYGDGAQVLLVNHHVSLAGLVRMTIRIRTKSDMTLVLGIEMRNGAAFLASRAMKAGEWAEWTLKPDCFRPNPASVAAKAALCPDDLMGAFTLIDANALAGHAAANELEIAWVEIETADLPVTEGPLDVKGTLRLSASQVIRGQVKVPHGSELIVAAPRIQLEGGIDVCGGSVLIEGGVFSIPSRFAHQRAIAVTEGGRLAIADAALDTSFPVGVLLRQGGQMSVARTRMAGFFTVSLEAGGSLQLCETERLGEVIAGEGCSLSIERSADLYLWLVLGRSFTGRLTLPQPAGAIETWSARPYQDVSLLRSRNIRIAVILTEGANGTFHDCHIVALANAYGGTARAHLRAIRNRAAPEGGVFEGGDRRVSFENTTVGPWNIYVTDDAVVEVEDSLLGEAWGLGGRGTLTLRNVSVDGTGGNVRAQGNTRLVLENVTVDSSLIAADDARVEISGGELHGAVHAAGRSQIRIDGAKTGPMIDSEPGAKIEFA